jgi:hypothetical protein
MTVIRSCGGLPRGETTLHVIRLTAFYQVVEFIFAFGGHCYCRLRFVWFVDALIFYLEQVA